LSMRYGRRSSRAAMCSRRYGVATGASRQAAEHALHHAWTSERTSLYGCPDVRLSSIEAAAPAPPLLFCESWAFLVRPRLVR
jgi:hypothetical protein